MFEDELAYLIEEDNSVDNVIIIENDESYGIKNKLNKAGVDVETKTMVNLLNNPLPDNQFNIVIQILEFALHATPKKLKDEVYTNTKRLTPISDGILLFYGLCGNVLSDIEEDFADHPCPVGILRENNGETIDDCIGAVLGGRQEYLDTLKSFKGEGAFFLTPMWAANWRDMLVSSGFGKDKNDIETSRYVFNEVGYKHVAKVDTGINYEEDFHQKVDEFADLFDFDILHVPANLKTLKQCYNDFKEELD